MKKFEYLEDIATADVAIRAYGKSMEEMFANAALAMENLIVDIDKIKDVEKRSVEVHGTDYYALLYQWLEELLIFFDTELMLFRRFDIKIKQEGDEFILYGTAYGQELSDDMEIKHEIKAITYHQMGIEKTKDGFMCQFILDL